MNLNSSYVEHVNIMKNLKLSDDFYEIRKPYVESFETIYQKVKSEEVNISNAKDFLNSLSKEELNTLQHYSGLADEINVSKLSDEGSYNLLLHHYEKYDFNNDGITEDGIARTASLIPQSLPNADKKALVDTFNAMDFKDVMMASIVLMSPPIFVNGEFRPSNKAMTMDDIKNRIDNILDPRNNKNSSLEFRDTIKSFWDLFTKNYERTLEEKAYYNIK